MCRCSRPYNKTASSKWLRRISCFGSDATVSGFSTAAKRDSWSEEKFLAKPLFGMTSWFNHGLAFHHHEWVGFFHGLLFLHGSQTWGSRSNFITCPLICLAPRSCAAHSGIATAANGSVLWEAFKTESLSSNVMSDDEESDVDDMYLCVQVDPNFVFLIFEGQSSLNWRIIILKSTNHAENSYIISGPSLSLSASFGDTSRCKDWTRPSNSPPIHQIFPV